MDTGQRAADVPDAFSARLKAATRSEHEEAEQHAFTQALLEGRLPREGYAAMVAQHHFIYLALEEVGRSLADDPVAGSVLFPELFRVPALERDLTTLYGPAWRERIEPMLTPPTRTYVARIRQMADQPAGYVAHHYTRYLGDLSGGRFIRDAAARAYGLAGDGVAFYAFDQLASIPRFKAEYRSRLDALELDETTRRRVVRETQLAYQLNIEVIADLGRRHPPELAA
ncbi:biliverdin-producing heme oxygenase [Allosalinactinospora lopnorensis]|uniref:biliverdin-producing heme oxygenase n=1 Tax=Allosalinactinospora lopnorensis TaxID=1352348 RepID=UPI000623C881|nr:biliverdin-producing heme oxygenase [Allosalinactinospora lopnorensis]